MDNPDPLGGGNTLATDAEVLAAMEALATDDGDPELDGPEEAPQTTDPLPEED